MDFSVVNPILRKMKTSFLAKLFNSTTVRASSIFLHDSKTNKHHVSTFKPKQRSISHYATISEKSKFSYSINNQLDHQKHSNAIYLPASRTGFILTYQYIVNRSLDAFLSNTDDEVAILRTKLTKPTIEFLKLLATGSDEGSHFLSEAQALEESLGGEIVKHSQAGFNQYEYRMKGAETNLPMSIVSTMVSELAPIITVLKSSDKIPFLVIEEPEAHLHPKAQRTLAVVIARLIRKGVRVVLTTHGDLFCHQLNNLIKLGSLPEPKRRALQKRFKLKETDYLLPQEVSGYGLTISKDRTHSVVEALKMTPYGLEMPTFNAEIDSLESQTDALDQAIEALK
jgi:hypothetical protein